MDAADLGLCAQCKATAALTSCRTLFIAYAAPHVCNATLLTRAALALHAGGMNSSPGDPCTAPVVFSQHLLERLCAELRVGTPSAGGTLAVSLARRDEHGRTSASRVNSAGGIALHG